jgi:molecular chaperone HtpG
VAEYLSQVAPVPFAPDFKLGEQITSALGEHVDLAPIELRIAGVEGQIYRPFRDEFQIGEKETDRFTEVSISRIEGIDGGLAAIAWVLHHGYTGAIPVKAQIKGLRARSGNIQIGEHALFEELFPEPRFNAWTVGEVHVVDSRIIPNGRRDHFEQNVHYDNLINSVGIVPESVEIGVAGVDG